MRVQLVDVDSTIPNLALMKISTHHKINGDSVELVRCGLEYYPHNKTAEIGTMFHEKTYVSIIFTTNKNRVSVSGFGDVEFGGSGYDLQKKLSEEIDMLEPDYSIYPECDYSIGFISRGCVRNCPFCFVPKKEGKLQQVRTPKEIVRHKKVMFLDNNFLALANHKELLREINALGVSFQFNQGLDIRLLDDVTSDLLAKSKTFGEIYFSYDLIQNKGVIENKILKFRDMLPAWKIKLFLYVHPDNNIDDDVIYRVNFCKENKILPYVMRDISCFSSNKKTFYNDLAAWANQPSFFKTNTFEQFLVKRHSSNRAGFSVYQTMDNDVAFSATDDQITEVK